MSDDRTRCCVPLCTRWRSGTGDWICGKHWPLVPKPRRKLFSKAWRRYTRLWRAAKDERPLKLGAPIVSWAEVERARLVMERCWRMCKRTVSGTDGPPADVVAFMREWGIDDARAS